MMSVKRNPYFSSLKTNYLFPEINLRKNEYLAKNPDALLISLGIGDTTAPITPSVTKSLIEAAACLGTTSGYSGYGPEQGMLSLRQKIASKIYNNTIRAEEVFVSDGAKCDLGRLQTLFGREVSIAVQDPVYPVYVEGSIIQGVKDIVLMKCCPENDFFPDLDSVPRTDLIYFCSPNNPTGAAATKSQLEDLVAFALKNRSIIIYDAAYAHFISDPKLPKSIFEIQDAKKVAIEVNSFSKIAGFTGIRLAWTVVPGELLYEDGMSVKTDWNRLACTVFNGASNIAQKGGHAVLDEQGQPEIGCTAAYYMENARLLRETLEGLGFEVFGGMHAPYLWVRFQGQRSWDVFQHFLEHYHIITTPGSGFGLGGEEFIRLSAFGQREHIHCALDRIGSGSSFRTLNCLHVSVIGV
jgi:LL-diaminopimelate aminotransferase